MTPQQREQAEKAIRAYLDGEASPTGKRLFELWYAQQPNDEQPDAPLPTNAATADRIWQRIEQQAGIQPPGADEEDVDAMRPLPVRRQVGWSWAVAAAIVLAIGVVAMGWYRTERTAPAPVVAYTEHTNQPGQRSVVRLPDGSTVHLNAASQLRFPKAFADNQREVWLTGEGLFDVRRDPQKPFVVHSGTLTTTVLGTSFNVHAYPDASSHVAVLTGKVRVNDGRTAVLLLPNQVADYNPATQQLTQTNAINTANYTAWTTGRLVFERQTVAAIVAVLERHYNVDITLTNKRLAGNVINAEFDNEPLTRVLDLLCNYLQTPYRRQGRTVTIGRQRTG